jgi:hypothetical protein
MIEPTNAELAAQAECRDEQAKIWADEFVERLLAADCAPTFNSYDEKIRYFSAVEEAIKDVVENAFDHPGLKGEVDPRFGTTRLVGNWPFRLVNGADDDEENETEDRRGAEGEDRFGGGAGTSERGRPGAAL